MEQITPVSDDFKDIINRMLSYDPAKRPTVAELKEHPWMQQYKVSSKENIVQKIRV